eukprot:8943328-Prorocentrum_lima.AAC.1
MVPGSSSGSGSHKRVRVTGKQTPSAAGDPRNQQCGREPSRRADYQAFYGVLQRAVMAQQASDGSSQGRYEERKKE